MLERKPVKKELAKGFKVIESGILRGFKRLTEGKGLKASREKLVSLKGRGSCKDTPLKQRKAHYVRELKRGIGLG